MLTIDEIKNISFRKASRSGGYRAEDVDAFIDEVIDRLATRLEEYREDEETVRNALLTSQKMSDACIKEAREKAAKILRDAEEKSQNMLAEANKSTALEKEKYLRLQADAVDLRNELIALYTKHIKSIDDLPTTNDVENSRQELDEKYPTEPLEQPAPKAEPEAKPAAAAPEAAPAPKTEAPKVTDATTRVAIKRPGKFNHLKFGDNYDVSDE